MPAVPAGSIVCRPAKTGETPNDMMGTSGFMCHKVDVAKVMAAEKTLMSMMKPNMTATEMSHMHAASMAMNSELMLPAIRHERKTEQLVPKKGRVRHVKNAEPMNRPSFLARTAALGAAGAAQPAVAQTAPSAPPAVVPSAAPSPVPKRFSNFFTDSAMNFVLLNTLGQCAYGFGDVGTTLAIFDQIEDGNAASAFNAMTAMGYRIMKQADVARAAGHRISARDLYLQASNYIYQSLYFCDGMGAPEKMLPTFTASRAAFDNAMPLLGYPVEHVRIPYEHTTMPGYFIKPDASNKTRPLFVMVNGSDGSVLDMWGAGRQSGDRTWIQRPHLRWTGSRRDALAAARPVPL